MTILKKAAAVLTAAGLAAACVACGSNTRFALTIDGYEVPAGVYIYFVNSAYNTGLSQLGEEQPDLDTTDVKAVKAASLEGVSFTDWVKNKATEMCTDFVTTEKKFDELGLSLDAMTKSYVDSMTEYYWAQSKTIYERNGISEESFAKIVTSDYKSNLISEHFYGVGGKEGVTEDELYDYFKENNIRCQYVAVDLKDGEGNLLKADGKEKMMDMLEGYQDRVEDAYDNGGVGAVMTEMSYVQEDYNYYVTSVSQEAAGVTGEALATTTARTTPASTTTAATSTAASGAETTTETVSTEEENGTTAASGETSTTTTTTTTTTAAASDAESGTETTADPYALERTITVVHKEDYEDEADIVYNPCESVYNKLLEITESDYGKPFIVEDDEKYYLVVRYDIEERMTAEDLWSENAVSSTSYSKYSKDFDDKMDEWANAMSVQRNDAAYKRYDPFKLDFTADTQAAQN